MIKNRWILFVILLLAGNVFAVGCLIVASGDDTPRVLPDYYNRAASYDDRLALEKASRALGWRATPTLRGDALAIELVDARGAALAGLTVHATIDPRGRADRTEEAALVETTPGVYASAIAPGAPGLYVVAIDATRGDDHFVFEETLERKR